MIVHDRPLLDDTSQSTDDDRDDTPSMAILQAALEIRREDREWLGNRLSEGRSEQSDLHVEVDRLNDALKGREAAISALSEQATASANLTSQLTRQVSVLWEERERLLRFLQDASTERDRMVASLEAITRERDAMAAELGRDGANADGATAPVEMGELAHSMELMSEAIGEIRRMAYEARQGEPAAQTVVAAVETSLRHQLEPISTLPDLRSEVARLSARIDEMTAGLSALLAPQ